MRAGESIKFGPITATTAAFTLKGGVYKASAIATWGGGSAKLEMLGPDGTTFLEVDSTNSSFTANGNGNVALPPGQYKWVIATATGVYVSVTRIPGD